MLKLKKSLKLKKIAFNSNSHLEEEELEYYLVEILPNLFIADYKAVLRRDLLK